MTTKAAALRWLYVRAFAPLEISQSPPGIHNKSFISATAQQRNSDLIRYRIVGVAPILLAQRADLRRIMAVVSPLQCRMSCAS